MRISASYPLIIVSLREARVASLEPYLDSLCQDPAGGGDEGLLDRLSEHLHRHGPEELLETIIGRVLASIRRPPRRQPH